MGRYVHCKSVPTSVRAAAFVVVSPHLVDPRASGVNDRSTCALDVDQAVCSDSRAIEALHHRRTDDREFHDEQKLNPSVGVANKYARQEHFEGGAAQLRSAADNVHMLDRQHAHEGCRGRVENKNQRQGSCPANPDSEVPSHSRECSDMKNLSSRRKVRGTTVVW